MVCLFFYRNCNLYNSSLYSEPFKHDFIIVSVPFQALNEISEREGDPEYEEEDMGGGSLLR